MEIKPNIFIGSSREGINVAKLVKKHLSDFADCTIWEEDVFEFNKGYFETLIELLSFYDYGIMVGTGDDFVRSRDVEQQETRDNVLFEFGLFVGRLGRERVFMFMEKGIKVPSDLHGIAIPQFSSKDAPDLEAQIEQLCERLKKQISQKEGIFDGGIFPAVPLAYGYFYNSILPACERLTDINLFKIGEIEYPISSFQFTILIPDDLRSDMKEKVKAARLRKKWTEINIPTGPNRSYIFYTEAEKTGGLHLEISDIPTTLNSLYQTINEFAGTTKIGESFKEKIIEAREIRRFQKVLDYLIAKSSFTKGYVVTKVLDI